MLLLISLKVGISKSWLLSIDGASIKAFKESITFPLTEFSLKELKVVVTLFDSLVKFIHLFCSYLMFDLLFLCSLIISD